MTHILVVGSGGREHALVWKLSQSARTTRISAAPGNAGTAQIPCTANIPVDATDVVSLLEFAEDEQVDLVVVGPEEPLAGGLVDQMEAAGVRTFGPCHQAAMIEVSKSYAKSLMREHDVPTPNYEVFSDVAPAIEYLYEHPTENMVIKADGLARGKGVFLPQGQSDAEGILRSLLERDSLGTAGRQVIIEERLRGQEISVMAFTDGKTLAIMPPVRDYKRRFDGDRGPNTGGMGSYAPVPFISDAMLDQIRRRILEPVLDAIDTDTCYFRGVLNAGIVITPEGPFALELNARFGDPAAQVVLPLLETDLVDVLEACIHGSLATLDLQWQQRAAVSVVLATPNYPEHQDIFLPMFSETGLPDDILVFHAGTRMTQGETVMTTGGRIADITGIANDLESAVTLAYDAITHINAEGLAFRTDIGSNALRS